MALPNTHFGAEYIRELLSGGSKKLFFAGIGGVSMCSLAYISKLRGHKVSGYDRTPSATTRSLEKEGIEVYYSEDISHIDGVDVLIYTVAIPADNTEYKGALERGIPCISRADFLGYLMSGYKSAIGVSGTHGKSTTTAMLERIFCVGQFNPTVSCGAVMNDTGTAHRIGDERVFIFEACEYMDSFLDFYPTTAIILNLEMDHVDYFESLDQMIESYRKFIAKTGKDGYTFANLNDENVMKATEGYMGNLVTFGVENKNADYCAENVVYEAGCGRFDLLYKGKFICRIELSVFGEHSVTDALGAAAIGHTYGIEPELIAKGLATYTGASRRMQYSGTTAKGAYIFNDYGHHPTEIKTTLEAACKIGCGKSYCVFQPHTYSRTKALFDDFASALADSGCYEIILSSIYSAREKDTLGVSSEALSAEIRKRGKRSVSFADFGDIATYVAEVAEEGDVVVVMGAGDIPVIIERMK